MAPLGYRLLARVLDVVAFAFLMAFGYVEIARRFVGSGSTNLVDAATSSELSLRVTFVVLSIAYDLIPVALGGRTLGKGLLGLRVQRIDAPTARVGFVRAGGRWLVLNGSLAVPYVGLLLYAVVVGWVLIDRRRQGLHDKLAGTVVVDVGLGGGNLGANRSGTHGGNHGDGG